MGSISNNPNNFSNPNSPNPEREKEREREIERWDRTAAEAGDRRQKGVDIAIRVKTGLITCSCSVSVLTYV